MDCSNAIKLQRPTGSCLDPTSTSGGKITSWPSENELQKSGEGEENVNCALGLFFLQSFATQSVPDSSIADVNGGLRRGRRFLISRPFQLSAESGPFVLGGGLNEGRTCEPILGQSLKSN